jgi:hypothetical protein
MSRKDFFHEAVKNSLIKQRWIITHDLLELEWEEVTVKVDLGAECLIAAERDTEKIAVEVKSFITPSTISDFHTAVGRFLNYQVMLEVNDPERILYLAIPIEIHETFFQSQFVQTVIKRHALKLVIYDPVIEEILQWKK